MNDCQTCHFRICDLPKTGDLMQNQIQYCRPQILQLLINGWAFESKVTGYIDTHEDVQTPIPQHAPFESLINVLAEIKIRLGIFDGMVDSETRALSAWPDGITLVEEIDKQMTEVVMGKKRVADVEPSSSAAWRALGYAGCGPERRREPYKHWKDRKYGKKKGTKVPIKK